VRPITAGAVTGFEWMGFSFSNNRSRFLFFDKMGLSPPMLAIHPSLPTLGRVVIFLFFKVECGPAAFPTFLVVGSSCLFVGSFGSSLFPLPCCQALFFVDFRNPERRVYSVV